MTASPQTAPTSLSGFKPVASRLTPDMEAFYRGDICASPNSSLDPLTCAQAYRQWNAQKGFSGLQEAIHHACGTRHVIQADAFVFAEEILKRAIEAGMLSVENGCWVKETCTL